MLLPSRSCLASRFVLPQLFALLVAAFARPAWADAFAPAVNGNQFDPAAFAEWADGAEKPVAVKNGPKHVMWTRDSSADWDGVKYGESTAAGPRHLRVGFTEAVPVGSVLVRGGGRVSVLKSDAKYPGDVTDEGQWVPAQRIKPPGTAGEALAVSTDEVSRDEYAVWVLPPGTKTRAVRFSHVPAAADATFGGWLGGAVVLADRYANLAPQAVVLASSNEHAAGKVVDGRSNSWQSWDNGKEGAADIVSADRAEWVTLVWPAAVPVRGTCFLGAGFGDAQVQLYRGPADRHPREASPDDWQTAGGRENLHNQYPRNLGPDWIDLASANQARALRVRITKAGDEPHPHLKGNTKGGKRVWLDELLVLSPLGDKPLETAILPPPRQPHPPIPVKFTLKEAGLVTLVIEDADGKRVRNLVSETPFPAGDNVAWWDGTDDLGRDPDAAAHGVYHVPGAFVKPAAYRVRGLARPPLQLRYEMTVYNPGNPPWPTADHTGGWLADHSPPSAVLALPSEKRREKDLPPRVLIGSHVAEGGDGLVFVDLAGKKVDAIHWLGGNWTGASHLARDEGSKPVPDTYAYTGSDWEQDNAGGNVKGKTGELRLMALTDKGPRPVLIQKLSERKQAELRGLAVRDGLLVAANAGKGELVFVDAAAGKPIGTAAVPGPRGIAFDRDGRLLVLSDKSVLRYILPKPDGGEIRLPMPVILVKGTLEDPQGIALDKDGNVYVSDRGTAHVVKVFAPDGKPLRTIGTPGGPKVGPYDPTRMLNPNGLTVDADGRLWVAETDFQPKRVGVWTPDGKLVNAFYGPPQYGGGGCLDSKDKRRFYHNGMEFRLDWDKGTNQLAAIYCRAGTPAANPLKRKQHYDSGLPETPVYVGGRQYMTNGFNSNPTNGADVAGVWLMRDGAAVPVAAAGRAEQCELFKEDRFKSRLPDKADVGKSGWLFAWSDLNGNGEAEPDEVTFVKEDVGSVTVQRDLSIVTTGALCLRPVRFADTGVPVYDAGKADRMVDGAQRPTSSGGGQALIAQDGRLVLTVAPKPFAPQSVGGAKAGSPYAADWSYPSPWPGLHASHSAPLPDHPGELIGTTRLLGFPFAPKGSDAGELWAVNGNKGNVYLFTTDGLFVATLFRDGRLAGWAMPRADRGMDVATASINEEDFWPSVTQTEDGRVYLTVGVQTTSTLVEVRGLEGVRRLSAPDVTVTSEQLAAANDYFLQRDAERIARAGQESLKVSLRDKAPDVDGKMDDWAGAAWVTIDARIKQVGDWGKAEQKAEPAVAVAGDRLYVALKTGEPNSLANSGESPNLLFKTGGALDIQVAANAAADPKRAAPAEGDVRLLVALVKGKPMAVAYRPVVPGTKEPVAFRSPWRAVNIDRVDDVSDQVKVAAGADGTFELSVPLAVLGLKPQPGQAIRGDVGLLRGNGFQTFQRVYWQNKAAGLTADVPGEAMLTPQLWGRWEFGPAR